MYLLYLYKTLHFFNFNRSNLISFSSTNYFKTFIFSLLINFSKQFLKALTYTSVNLNRIKIVIR